MTQTRDFDAELKAIRQEAQKAERTKIQLETRKEQATELKAKYEEECKALGVDPKSLDDEIKKLNGEIVEILDKIKVHLPEAETDDEEAF